MQLQLTYVFFLPSHHIVTLNELITSFKPLTVVYYRMLVIRKDPFSYFSMDSSLSPPLSLCLKCVCVSARLLRSSIPSWVVRRQASFMSSVNFTSPPDQISDRQGAESLNGISKRHNLIVRLSEPRFTLHNALFVAWLLDTRDDRHKKRDQFIKCI